MLRLAFERFCIVCCFVKWSWTNPFKTFWPPVKAAIIYRWSVNVYATNIVLTFRNYFYIWKETFVIIKPDIYDKTRAEDLLQSTSVAASQGLNEVTYNTEPQQIQGKSSAHFSAYPPGGTVTTPVIYYWFIQCFRWRKWAWRWQEMCGSGLLISPDKEDQAFCYFVWPFISVLLQNIQTWFKR